LEPPHAAFEAVSRASTPVEARQDLPNLRERLQLPSVSMKGVPRALHLDEQNGAIVTEQGCRAEVVRLYRSDRIAPKVETYWVEPAAFECAKAAHRVKRPIASRAG
jgi:hypothetical protein